MFFLGSLIDQHFNGFFSIGGEAFQSGYVKALVLLKASSLSLSPCSVSDGLGVVSFIGLKSQISAFVPPPHLHSGKWGSFFIVTVQDEKVQERRINSDQGRRPYCLYFSPKSRLHPFSRFAGSSLFRNVNSILLLNIDNERNLST